MDGWRLDNSQAQVTSGGPRTLKAMTSGKRINRGQPIYWVAPSGFLGNKVRCWFLQMSETRTQRERARSKRTRTQIKRARNKRTRMQTQRQTKQMCTNSHTHTQNDRTRRKRTRTQIKRARNKRTRMQTQRQTKQMCTNSHTHTKRSHTEKTYTNAD